MTAQEVASKRRITYLTQIYEAIDRNSLYTLTAVLIYCLQHNLRWFCLIANDQQIQLMVMHKLIDVRARDRVQPKPNLAFQIF